MLGGALYNTPTYTIERLAGLRQFTFGRGRCQVGSGLVVSGYGLVGAMLLSLRHQLLLLFLPFFQLESLYNLLAVLKGKLLAHYLLINLS